MAQLAQACPELGTAQPQLVIIYYYNTKSVYLYTCEVISVQKLYIIIEKYILAAMSRSLVSYYPNDKIKLSEK